MNIDMLQLLKDHSIPHKTEGDKHCTPGWIQLRDCPNCGDGKFHLGWNIRSSYFNCWKCGKLDIEEVIIDILNIPRHECWIILTRYKQRPALTMLDELEIGKELTFVRPEKVIVPGFDIPSADTIAHRRYLERRGYDVDKIGPLWGLRGTSVFGDYKFRVMCPIWYDGKIVSYQGRDITGKAELRWKSCCKEEELRDHKHCLGGIQLAKGDACAIVEGFTDAWRLGPGAVGTFGTDYLLPQVQLLRRFKRRFHVFDSSDKDPNAARQAQRLADMLSAFGGEDIFVELDSGDPGDLPQREADYLMEKEWRIR